MIICLLSVQKFYLYTVNFLLSLEQLTSFYVTFATLTSQSNCRSCSSLVPQEVSELQLFRLVKYVELQSLLLQGNWKVSAKFSSLSCHLNRKREEHTANIFLYYRGEKKVKYLQSLGIDFVVDLSNEGVIESVKAFLKSKKLKGVDVLYDPVGGKLMKDSMKLLNWGAQILIIGFASGEIPVIPANIALVKV